MTRAKVSGDCRMTANNPPQASTHNRATTPNAVIHVRFPDLRFLSKLSFPKNFFHQSDAIIGTVTEGSII